MKTNKPGYKWFRRPCDKCGILFVRTGKFHKVCERCKKLTYKKACEKWRNSPNYEKWKRNISFANRL